MKSYIDYLISCAREYRTESGEILPQYTCRYNILVKMIGEYYINLKEEAKTMDTQTNKECGCWLNCTLSPSGQVTVRLERSTQRDRRYAGSEQCGEKREFKTQENKGE